MVLLSPHEGLLPRGDRVLLRGAQELRVGKGLHGHLEVVHDELLALFLLFEVLDHVRNVVNIVFLWLIFVLVSRFDLLVLLRHLFTTILNGLKLKDRLLSDAFLLFLFLFLLKVIGRVLGRLSDHRRDLSSIAMNKATTRLVAKSLSCS